MDPYHNPNYNPNIPPNELQRYHVNFHPNPPPLPTQGQYVSGYASLTPSHPPVDPGSTLPGTSSSNSTPKHKLAHNAKDKGSTVDATSETKRRKFQSTSFALQPSTLDKFIVGVWEQIHGSISLDPQSLLEQCQVPSLVGMPEDRMQPVAEIALPPGSKDGALARFDGSFNRRTVFCRKVTQASRACRSIEVIVQARWIEHFEAHVQALAAANPDLSPTKQRKAALMEACSDFGWTEKELRNKMAIWRGYKEVKDAAGWAALVFAGMGLYRFCKYRVGFDEEGMRRLRSLRTRLEVAADTLHPNWRQLLSIIGEPTQRLYTGHPHDWVVFEDGADPIPLRATYMHYGSYFGFEHLDQSIVDVNAFGGDDPRWTPPSNALSRVSPMHICESCGKEQSDDPKLNTCYCFPTLFGCAKRGPACVQVFRTADGRNNGLMALTAFEEGSAIGEFVGLVTKGVRDMDVMDSATTINTYQIWQGRQGNYTRFVNHSCKANAAFQQFTWLDTQRIVLVSKGIDAGQEITVDYSDRYWAGLDKNCLCGEECCRYRRDGLS